MLAGLKRIPVPRWAALIVMREFPYAESRSVLKLGRQRKDGSVGRERLRQVYDVDGASVELFYELCENI